MTLFPWRYTVNYWRVQHPTSSMGFDNVCLQRRDLPGLVMHQSDTNSNAWFHRILFEVDLWQEPNGEKKWDINRTMFGCFHTTGRLFSIQSLHTCVCESSQVIFHERSRCCVAWKLRVCVYIWIIYQPVKLLCVGLSNLRNSFQFCVFLSLFLMHEDFHKQMNDRREKSKIVVSTV